MEIEARVHRLISHGSMSNKTYWYELHHKIGIRRDGTIFAEMHGADNEYWGICIIREAGLRKKSVSKTIA
jgi:hypothetical protein